MYLFTCMLKTMSLYWYLYFPSNIPEIILVFSLAIFVTIFQQWETLYPYYIYLFDQSFCM